MCEVDVLSAGGRDDLQAFRRVVAMQFREKVRPSDADGHRYVVQEALLKSFEALAAMHHLRVRVASP